MSAMHALKKRLAAKAEICTSLEDPGSNEGTIPHKVFQGEVSTSIVSAEKNGAPSEKS